MSKEGPITNESSEEDVKKVGKQNMTREQKIETKTREDYYESRESKGLGQNIRQEKYNDGHLKSVSATINGRKVELEWDEQNHYISGKIDDIELSPNEATKIFQKHASSFEYLDSKTEGLVAKHRIRKQAIKDVLEE